MAGTRGRAAARKHAAPAGQSEQPLMRTLRAEHRHMAAIMHLFAQQLDALEAGEPADAHVLFEIMDYMVSWPDRYHHPREDLIYGRLAEIDATAARAVADLQSEHERSAARGRDVLHDIECWRQGALSGAALVASGRDYLELLRRHMAQEESTVFPHMESVLQAQDWLDLAAEDRLQPVADPVFGRRVHRQYRNLARKLRRNLRREVERGALLEWVGIEALLESLEVVSMACETARLSTAEHLKEAWQDALGTVRDTPLTAPLRCLGNNTRLSLRLARTVAGISGDAWRDLVRINRERRDHMHLVERVSPRR
ncbi:MAG: hemerythrin domain-containing protein [Halioglobus sp.]|nr:hemerythrin domain-containing protein [Halioglobus sp.]